MFILPTCPKCKSRDVMHFRHINARLDQFCACGNNLTAPQIKKQVAHRRANVAHKRTRSRRMNAAAFGAVLCLWAFGAVLGALGRPDVLLYERAYAEEVMSVPPVVAPVETIREKIDRYAAKYGVSGDEIYRTLACESQNFIDPKIQAKFVGTRGRERSFGYAQIHLTSHPYVSYEQAIDPDFAFDFTAKNWKKHKDWWVCAKLVL